MQKREIPYEASFGFDFHKTGPVIWKSNPKLAGFMEVKPKMCVIRLWIVLTD